MEKKLPFCRLNALLVDLLFLGLDGHIATTVTKKHPLWMKICADYANVSGTPLHTKPFTFMSRQQHLPGGHCMLGYIRLGSVAMFGFTGPAALRKMLVEQIEHHLKYSMHFHKSRVVPVSYKAQRKDASSGKQTVKNITGYASMIVKMQAAYEASRPVNAPVPKLKSNHAQEKQNK